MNQPTHHEAFSGGCQCGAVRFHVTAGLAEASVCHCRMCQRATGNAFAPLMMVPRDRVRFEGEPQEWASSNISVRGFCKTCGSPLYFADIEREVEFGEKTCRTIEFMAGALDRGTVFDPVSNHGIEARMDWVARLPALTDRETFFTQGETIISHQSEEG